MVSDYQEVGGKSWPCISSDDRKFLQGCKVTQFKLIRFLFTEEWLLSQEQNLPQPLVAIASGTCVWKKEEVFSSNWHWSQFGRLGWQVNLGTWCLDEPWNTSWCYDLCECKSCVLVPYISVFSCCWWRVTRISWMCYRNTSVQVFLIRGTAELFPYRVPFTAALAQ